MRSKTFFLIILLTAVGLFSARKIGHSLAAAPESKDNEGTVSGELKKWHPVTVDFVGPQASETDNPPWRPNPFLDYRLQLTLIGPSNQVYVVPGFFDGDGNGGMSGNVWRAIFAPDEAGQWRYEASFRAGNKLAISLDPLAGLPADFDGAAGTFFVEELDGSESGFLKWGRLEYVGDHYLKFRDGPHWMKGGTNSPENLLGYAGFDNTIDQGGLGGDIVHYFGKHADDWRPGDPNFVSETTGYNGKGIIGALNYLSEQHVNSIYFLPMNLGGDGQETYPFVAAPNTVFNKTHYDISKLRQWSIVLDHAQRKGIALQLVLAETETPNELWLDDGLLGVERKLFYRELVARFGHLLAIKWNLSEENDYPVASLHDFADYIQALDSSNHPIAVHNKIDYPDIYADLLADERFSATSFQYHMEDAGALVEFWRQESAQAGRPWILDMDESNGGFYPDKLRKEMLYDIYFSGGNVEWFSHLASEGTPQRGDLTLEDFRLREAVWKYTWYARKLLEEHLPFWKMMPYDELLSGEAQDYGGGEVFALPGQVYAVYLPNATPGGSLDLSDAPGHYTLRWYNPRTGEFEGLASEKSGGGLLSLGEPPSDSGKDWVVLLEAVAGREIRWFMPVVSSMH